MAEEQVQRGRAALRRRLVSRVRQLDQRRHDPALYKIVQANGEPDQIAQCLRTAEISCRKRSVRCEGQAVRGLGRGTTTRDRSLAHVLSTHLIFFMQYLATVECGDWKFEESSRLVVWLSPLSNRIKHSASRRKHFTAGL